MHYTSLSWILTFGYTYFYIQIRVYLEWKSWSLLVLKPLSYLRNYQSTFWLISEVILIIRIFKICINSYRSKLINQLYVNIKAYFIKALINIKMLTYIKILIRRIPLFFMLANLMSDLLGDRLLTAANVLYLPWVLLKWKQVQRNQTHGNIVGRRESLPIAVIILLYHTKPQLVTVS